MSQQPAEEATPSPNGLAPRGIELISIPDDLEPAGMASLLWDLPSTVDGLEQQEPTSIQDSATVVYIADQTAAQPRFGMIVVLFLDPAEDARATVRAIEEARWGERSLHMVTNEGKGDGDSPAFVEFWRTFPPGQFVLPNQPVYFMIWYRPNDRYAFMVIGGTAAIREALTRAVAETFTPSNR
jgi:hypothetical protein